MRFTGWVVGTCVTLAATGLGGCVEASGGTRDAVLEQAPLGDGVIADAERAGAPLADAAECHDGGAALRRQVRGVHDEQRNVGLAVGVWRGDGVAFREYLGFADLEFEAPVDASTRFGIASVTKAFTGALVLKLVAEGRLDLDAPVTRYVELDAPWADDLTARLLLSHLSGVPHPRDRTPELFATHYETATAALEVFADAELLAEPGAEYSYSSSNYNLLAAIVEAITGQPFPEAMGERVLDPLGLDGAGFDDVLEVRPGRARRYSFFHPWTYEEGDELLRVPTWDYSFNPGGGNMYATLDALLSFGSALLAPGFFTAESWEHLFQPVAEGSGSNWSFGWFVGSDPPMGRRLVISGSNPGLQAGLGVFVEHETVVAALSNTWGKNARTGDLIDVGTFARLCLGVDR